MKIKQIIPVLFSCLGLIYVCSAQETSPATNSPAPTPEQAQPAAVPAPTAAAAAPAVTEAAAPAATPTAAPAAPVSAGGVIPLIQFVDAPLTAVIENLARQAGINYILDPKINYGQPGPDGKMVALPSISIRWENLTADQALNALLQNYGLQLTEDTKSKIARISPKDPAAAEPLLTKVIQLKFASPSNILMSAKSCLIDKRSRVEPDSRTSQLVVVGTEKEVAAVEDLVMKLDTMTKQVLIEARLIETSLNPKTTKGVDWSGTLQAQNVSWGNNNQSLPVTSGESKLEPLSSAWSKMILGGGNPTTFFLNADGVSAALSFLNTDSDAKIIATPRAVTLDNETANLSVTEARPIFKTTAGTQGSPGGSEVTYTNLGTILRVTPRISANNFVNLRVIPEVSTFVKTIRKIVSGQINEADVFAFRTIDTQVLIPSGNTLVLGGLISDASTKGYTKVPVLGDIPGIGLGFRNESKERLQKNLIIFITPTIVQDGDFQPTQSDYLKTKPTEPSQKPWSAWDSGKPAFDWTKPSGGTVDK